MRRFTVALVATAVVSTGLLAAGPPATAAPLLPFPVGTVLIGRDASDAVILLAPDGTGSTYGQDGALQLAVDGFGDGFAVDRSNSVIEHLADGTIRVPIGLAHPVGEIAVSPAGDLFVPDRGHGTVIKAPADGGPATTLGVGLVGAEGVAVDPVGNVYVTGGSPVGTVTEIPADGGPQRPVVSNLSQPMGIVAAPNGDLYVADLGAAQVLRFPGGGGPGVPVGSGWVRPSQLALDAFGNVYVRDSGRPGITVVAAGTGSQRTVGAGIPLPASVAVFAPPPTFGPGLTVPTGVVGKAYTTGTPTVTVPPNEPAPTYSVVNGVLPQGLSLDPVTGRISGTPQVPGTYLFRLQVANAATGTVSGPLSITVASPGFVAA